MFNKLKCWYYGHDRSHTTMLIGEEKHYYCERCNLHSTNHWDIDSDNFWWRHETLKTVFGFIGMVLALVAFFGLIALIVFLITYPFFLHSCKQTGIAMELPWKYNFWTGCLYEIKGQWITKDLLNVVELLK